MYRQDGGNNFVEREVTESREPGAGIYQARVVGTGAGAQQQQGYPQQGIASNLPTAYTTTTTYTTEPVLTSNMTQVPVASHQAAHQVAHQPIDGRSKTIVEVRPVASPTGTTLRGHYEDAPVSRADGEYPQHIHGHRHHLMHLGPDTYVGSGARDRDYEAAMERRRLETTQIRADSAGGFTSTWYKLENESLADRTRFPVRGAGILRFLNIIFFLGAITISILSVADVFRHSHQNIYDIYFTRFTPAAYVLAVYAVVYFFMALFVIYQCIPYQRTNLVLFHDITFLFIVACILNILYDLLFCYEYMYAAAGVCTGLLIVLITIYVRIGVGWKKAVPPLEYLCVHVLFGVWMAWVSVETIFTWAQAARGDGWFGEPWTGEGWSILFMCMLGFFTLMLLLFKRDGNFGLVVGFCFVAIAVKNRQFDTVPLTFYITGGVLMILSILALIAKFILWRRECRDREIVILKR